ncbi:dapper homolog 3-like [Pezoporus occidentalis]|uniref:dapper homolog 3-like n=1 Tax=Pezoporus occidentalis TaxID=407982 RepID=UPI002F911401
MSSYRPRLTPLPGPGRGTARHGTARRHPLLPLPAGTIGAKQRDGSSAPPAACPALPRERRRLLTGSRIRVSGSGGRFWRQSEGLPRPCGGPRGAGRSGRAARASAAGTRCRGHAAQDRAGAGGTAVRSRAERPAPPQPARVTVRGEGRSLRGAGASGVAAVRSAPRGPQPPQPNDRGRRRVPGAAAASQRLPGRARGARRPVHIRGCPKHLTRAPVSAQPFQSIGARYRGQRAAPELT